MATLAHAEPLTLVQALKEADERHPLLAAADGRVSTAQGLLQQAGLRPNPRLSIQVENLRGPWQGSFNYVSETDNFVWLSQTIETAKKRQFRSDLAAENRGLAEGAKELLRQQVAARVKQAWWVAVGAERARGIYEETRKNFRLVVEYHETRVKEGAMAEVDLIRIRLEAERLALAANNAQLSAERGRINLQREMGRSEFAALELADGLDERAVLPGEDVGKAMELRAELVLGRKAILAAQANQRLQVAMAKPNYDVLAGYKHTIGQETALVGLQFDLPLNNKNQGNVAAAVAEIRVAENNLKASEAVVKAEVRAAAVDVNLRKKQVEETLGPLRAQAAETARIAMAAYREGGTDLLRLLDAERLRLETQLVYVQAMVEYRLAIGNLEAAMGVVQ